MQNMPEQPAGSFGAQTPPAKKGLSKGCIIGIIAAVVAVLLALLVVAASIGGLYWFGRQAANANAGPAGSRGTPGASADSGADAPGPTAAQTAAVAGGQTAAWEQQEISWTVPQRWGKHEVSSQTLLWRSPGSSDAASLIVNISPMNADFPAEVSLNAFYQQAQTRKSAGEVNEVRWLTLDGVRGVMFRESAPEDEDGPQRLQWMAYRKYKGQQQLVNVMLASRGKDFARHEDALYGVLYSTKLTK
ncbi:MAG: hypothetical protein LC800_06820 [Acidobacteria bacterium]|nr:hypothetical protein [Acidobacteriota bacterium]